MPSMTPMPTSMKYVNFEMPIRVDDGQLLEPHDAFLERAGDEARDDHEGRDTITSPFSSAQRLNCVLPGMRLMWLRVFSTLSSQPTSENDIVSHRTSVMRFSHVRIQESGPIITRSR